MQHQLLAHLQALLLDPAARRLQVLPPAACSAAHQAPTPLRAQLHQACSAARHRPRVCRLRDPAVWQQVLAVPPQELRQEASLAARLQLPPPQVEACLAAQLQVPAYLAGRQLEACSPVRSEALLLEAVRLEAVHLDFLSPAVQLPEAFSAVRWEVLRLEAVCLEALLLRQVLLAALLLELFPAVFLGAQVLVQGPRLEVSLAALQAHPVASSGVQLRLQPRLGAYSVTLLQAVEQSREQPLEVSAASAALSRRTWAGRLTLLEHPAMPAQSKIQPQPRRVLL